MQNFYYSLTVRPASHHELFSDFLSDTLPVGFEELDDAFIIRSEDELETMAWGIEQFAEALQKALGQPIDVELVHEKLQSDDWVSSYQKSITPIEIAPFYIHPTWNEPKMGMLNIAIDPALAFGTGHHPTTATCLLAMAKTVKKDDRVIDVGCGSGILGIAALKLGAHVDACDTDPISVKNSHENALLNHIEFNKVWEGSAALTSEQYNVVIANIVADVLVMIASDLKKILKEKGTLILSGILDKYEDRVLKKYSDFTHVERIAQDEWVTLILHN
ncbi:MAG: 50S ribosomal protein L11 methyltransferase [Campylobacterota bacterium]|nr:50S ribosomal protein L11 methyltransferase [Campylobacterota bacterium]